MFSRACDNVQDFIERCVNLSSKLLTQEYRYHKLCKSFKKFYNRNTDVLSHYKLTFKSLIFSCIAHPRFYGDYIYTIRKIKQSNDFVGKLTQLTIKFVKKGYRKDILCGSGPSSL